MRKSKLSRIVSVTLIVLLFTCCIQISPSRAEDKPTLKQLEDGLANLKSQVAEYEKLIQQYKGKDTAPVTTGTKPTETTLTSELEKKVDKGPVRKGKILFTLPAMPGKFTIGGNLTGIVQYGPNVKLLGEKDDKNNIGGSYQANLTVTNDFEEVNGTALVNLRACQGEGLESNLTAYSNVDNNVDSPLNRVFLSELYYEQRLFDNMLTINFGKLDPTVFVDQNAYANSDPTQFLARIFNNSPVIEFPDQTGGLRVGLAPSDWMYADYLAMCGQSDWSNIQSDQFHLARIGFKTSFHDLKGNYRFLAWVNTNDHTKWMDTTTTKENNYGFSLSCDQQITDQIGIFGKFGWQNPRVFEPGHEASASSVSNMSPNEANYSLEYMWSGGMQIEGNLWGREQDFCGIAIGQVMPSSYMKKSLAGTPDARKALNEGHLEAYYNLSANKYLAISPMFQVIQNPYGGDSGADDYVYVFTLRTHVDF